MALSDKKVEELLDEYKKDPVSFRLKYGATAEADLLETAHKKGMTKEVEKKTAKYGGKMKKKYQAKGRVTSDKDADIELAWRVAKAEQGSGGKDVSELDFKHALQRVKGTHFREDIYRYLNELQSRGAAGKEVQPTNTGAVGKLQQLQQGLGMQYGGIADMSAAPMVKQQRQRKRRASSGFRTKYSKGGGVRKSKYSL